MGLTARFFLAAIVCLLGNGWLHWQSMPSDIESWVKNIPSNAGPQIEENEIATQLEKSAPFFSPRLTFLYLDREVGEVFSRWPLGPMDYAVLLRNLAASQPKTLVLYDPLQWDDESIATKALRSQAELLNIVQGCVLDAQPLVPLESVDFLTPILNVEGDIDQVPTFSGVSQLAAMKGLHDSSNGFTEIEFGVGPQVRNGVVIYPLLARLKDSLYPSFVLQTVLTDCQKEFNAVVVRMGESITVGDLVIPIDDAGQFGFPVDVRPLLIRLPADVVLPLDDSEIPPEEFVCQDVVMMGITEAPGIDLGDTHGKVALSELAAMAITAVQANKMLKPPPESDPASVSNGEPWYAVLLDLRWLSFLLGSALAASISCWLATKTSGTGVWLYFFIATASGIATLIGLGFLAAATAFASLSSAALVGHSLPGRA